MPTVPFHEVQFPPKIAYDYSGGPVFKTVVISADSGDEQRFQVWASGRCQYTISAGDQKPADAKALIAFFRARCGRVYGFRFKDWDDYQANLEVLDNTAGTTTLQLQRTYNDTINTQVRIIKKPVQGMSPTKRYTGTKLYKDTVLLTEGTDFTLDYTTGIITLAVAAPDSAFAWSGEFDVPVRFDVDQMHLGRQSQQVYNWADIPIIEVRV